MNFMLRNQNKLQALLKIIIKLKKNKRCKRKSKMSKSTMMSMKEKSMMSTWERDVIFGY